jgi:hypothetical protein
MMSWCLSILARPNHHHFASCWISRIGILMLLVRSFAYEKIVGLLVEEDGIRYSMPLPLAWWTPGQQSLVQERCSSCVARIVDCVNCGSLVLGHVVFDCWPTGSGSTIKDEMYHGLFALVWVIASPSNSQAWCSQRQWHCHVVVVYSCELRGRNIPSSLWGEPANMWHCWSLSSWEWVSHVSQTSWIETGHSQLLLMTVGTSF